MIWLAIRQSQDPADIAHGSLGFHSPKGDDLGDPVDAVFFRHVLDDAVAADIGDIHVDIGGTGTLRVHKTLKLEAVVQRVDRGDAQDIGNDRTSSRAAAGADPDAIALGPVDKVLHDQEVTGIAFGTDDVQLVLDPLVHLVGDIGIALGSFFPDQLLEIALGGHALGHGIFGVNHFACRDREITFVYDRARIFDRFGQIGKEVAHFLLRFQIKARRVDHGKAIFVV